MDVKNLFSFKALDKFMDEHRKNSDLFIELFQKKKKLLEFVRDKKLDAHKYLKMIQKCQAETTNDEIKGLIDVELCMLMEGEEAEWFNDILAETKEAYSEQEKMFKMFNQKQPTQPKPIPKHVEVEEPVKKETKSTYKHLNIEKIFSLKALDSLMSETTEKETYMRAFEQKEKMIELMKKGKLTGEVYLKSLKKTVDSNILGDLQITAEMELDDWETIHASDTMEWFMEVVNESGREYEAIQIKKYKAYQSGKPLPEDDDDIDINIDGDDIDVDLGDNDDDILNEVDTITGGGGKKQEESEVRKPRSKATLEPFCFKYIDEQIEAASENQTQFCKWFELKLAKIDKLKTGQINAEVYKSMLETIVSTTDNEELKMAAEAELDLDLGNVNEFFEAAVNATGAHFEGQQKTYNSLKGKKGSIFESEQKPDVEDIVSFSVLTRFLQKYKDPTYCAKLKEKGQKLLGLVEANRLGSNQYRLFLQKKLPQVTDSEMLEIMRSELKGLGENPSQKFKEYVQKYREQSKVGQASRNTMSGGNINESTIGQANQQTRVEYLLRKLSVYQSLQAYYKNNRLNKLLEALNPQYSAMKKKVLLECQLIGKGESETNLNLFVEENIPEITFEVFNRESRDSFNEKISKYIKLLENESKEYDEYTKRLKKGCNKENFETCAKAKQEIKNNIKYLQSIREENFVPLPSLELEKKTFYNLDLNKLAENEIQIIITDVYGLKGSTIFRLYVIDFQNHRFQVKIKEGQQPEINLTLKIPQNTMDEIIKGSDKKYVAFKLFEKGWFSESEIGSDEIELNFIRNNIQEGRSNINGEITVDYVIKVHKPKRPITTQIKSIKVTRHPAYEHTNFIESEFLKKMMPFEKPTQSELH